MAGICQSWEYYPLCVEGLKQSVKLPQGVGFVREDELPLTTGQATQHEFVMSSLTGYTISLCLSG